MPARISRAVAAGDLLAALTVVALLAPECVAYAQIAGLPPASGLAAAPVALLAYAVLGRSAQLVVGATAATAVISAATVAAAAGGQAGVAQRVVISAALTMVTGAVLIVTGVARCGFIARFLTEEALTGFLFGLAGVVLVREVGTIAGIAAGRGNVLVKGWHLLASLPGWSTASLVTGGAALAALLAVERYLPRLPATVLVLAAAWVVSVAAGLQRHGVAVVGRVPGVLPSAALPVIPAHTWMRLLGGAAGISIQEAAREHKDAGRTAERPGRQRGQPGLAGQGGLPGH